MGDLVTYKILRTKYGDYYEVWDIPGHQGNFSIPHTSQNCL